MVPRSLEMSGQLLDWVRSCDNYADRVPGPGAPPPAGARGYELGILRSRVDLGMFGEAYSWAREKSGEEPEWHYPHALAAHMTGRACLSRYLLKRVGVQPRASQNPTMFFAAFSRRSLWEHLCPKSVEACFDT